MAILINTFTKEEIYLNNQHTFGRNQQTSHTYIPESDISQFHAVIIWKENAWFIQDQSRNGTLVNGKFINNSSLRITLETKIQFGESKSTEWKIISCSPPNSYLKPILKENRLIELDSCFAFPNEENPDIFIYPSNDIWKLETKGTTKNLIPNQKYVINNEEYIFVENRALEDTMDMGFSIEDAYFQFILSPDEEHINLNLITKNREINLGERVHNYILLALARKRLVDRKANYSSNDQGWMEVDSLLNELSKELNKEVDIYYLNLKIHRIRKLLLDIKYYGPLFTNIIERRPQMIRLSHPYFQILKEEQTVAEILSN